MKAPKHVSEQARLAALRGYNILDSEPEKDFDEIVQVLGEICGMPVSLVSLVDESRQWFKARSGLDIHETPIEASVCAHGILQPELLEIRDLTKDVRTIDNPIVSGDPKFRFYAGAALTNAEGFPLGMLCVLDYQPRELTEVQRDLLRIMAKLVMERIELRRMLRQEQAAHALVQEVLDRANELLAHNSVLRREIDHRVKNSLAQVAAFLRLQEKRHGDEPRIMAALSEARNRVMTVVNVHDHLHRAAEDDKASVRQFVRNLVQEVSANKPPQLRHIEVDVDDVRLSSDKVMVIGVAINEIVSNAIKYAFREGDDGRLRITFRTQGENAVLRISDNGVGLPTDFDLNATKGLGLRVLMGAAQQLGGAVTHESSGQGAAFIIAFSLKDAVA